MLGATGSARAAGPVVVLSAVEAPASARRGVVVLASAGTPAEAAWPVALAVYGDTELRPKLADAEARVLAGEPPKEGAVGNVKELAELRAQVKGDDAASRIILAEIARRTGARAIAVVSVTDGATEVRVYDAAAEGLEGTRHRREASGWSPFASTLHSRFAPPTATTPQPLPEPEPKPRSLVSSPWLWAALGAAVIAGVVVYAVSSSSASPAPVVIRW